MRILFVSHNFIPQPTSEGSAIHLSTLIKTFQESGHQVHILIYGATDYSLTSGWKNEKKEALVRNLESGGIHTHILPKKDISELQKKSVKGNLIFRAVKRLFSPELIDFYEGPYYWQEIKEYAQAIDAEAVIAYSFEAVSAVCNFKGELPLVASTVDLDHVVRRLRRPRLQSYNLKAAVLYIYQGILLMRQSTIEIKLLKQCDLVYSHAAQHCQWLQNHGVEKATYLPVAVPDHAKEFFSNEKMVNKPLRIIMVGAVNNTATRMGIRYLANHIAPNLNLLWQKNRGFELQIFGGGKLEDNIQKKLDLEWVKIMGYVEDIGKEFYNSDILLVPIPDNLGFRTRISEGFSYGCCVITHSANQQGMPELKNDENCLICKNGGDFIAAISTCLNSVEVRRRISLAARKTYEECLDGRKVGMHIITAINEVKAIKKV